MDVKIGKKSNIERSLHNDKSNKKRKVRIKEPTGLDAKGEIPSDALKNIAPIKIYNSPLLWCMLALSRIYLSIVQTGYIHPDEFHQSLQVVAYDVLEIDAVKPWEFHSNSPIRSVAFLGIVSLPIYLLKTVNPFVKYVFGYNILTPQIILNFPRLFMTVLSFIADFCVYKIATRCYVRPWQCLEVFAGSYIMLVYATRTFSNNIELILFALLLWRVCCSIVDSSKIIRRESVLQDLFESVDTMKEKVKVMRVKSKLPPYNFVDSAFISVVVTFGIFARPTFLLYSLIPVAFWLQRGISTKEVPFSYFNWRCLSLLPGTVVVFILMVLADSFYYESITFTELVFWNVSANSFTVAPFNFFLYNSNATNLSTHGLHSSLLHIGVNIPLLFGVLGLVGLWSVSRYVSSVILYKFPKKPKVYSLATMLLLSFIVPVLGLSLVPHQEPRFILPAFVPLVILHSDKVSIYAIQKFRFTKHFLFLMWQVWNILCVVFYGFLHQGGVTTSLVYLHDYISSQPPSSNFHIFFSHMYSPPTFLLMQRIPIHAISDDGRRYMVPKNVTTYDLGSSLSAQNILELLNEFNEKNIQASLVLCISASMSKEIWATFPKMAHVKHIARIPWHLSLEHAPNLIINKSQLTDNCTEVCLIKQKLQEFSLDIFLINLNTNSSNIENTNTIHDNIHSHDEL